MINMFSSDIRKEIERFAPKELERFGMGENEPYGVLNIDVLMLFPFTSEEYINCKIGVLREDLIEDENINNIDIDTESFLFDDICYNHRYPNKMYFTISKKTGRKVCKIGYPVIGPIELLNSYKQITLQVGVKEEETEILRIPISVALTQDKSVTGINIKVYGTKSQNVSGIEFTSNEVLSNYGALTHYYHTGRTPWLDKAITHSFELVPSIQQRNTKEIIYDTEIKLYARSVHDELYL